METRSSAKRKVYPDLLQAIRDRNVQDVVTNLEHVGETNRVYAKAILTACTLGYDEIVAILLADARIDPTVDEESPFMIASKNGHTKVVALLLADSRIDPTINEQYAMDVVCELGHTDIVQLFLQDRRMDPTYDNFSALDRACTDGHIAIVRLLLEDTRMKRANIGREAFGFAFGSAAHEGHLAIVQLFLDEDILDPNIQDNYACIAACENGKIHVVRYLLQTGSVDPSAQGNQAIRWACQNGHIEVVQILLQYPSVNPTVKDNFPILTAAEHGHIDIVRLLLELPSVVANTNIFDTAREGAFAEPINQLILSKEKTHILPSSAVPNGAHTTCFDPIMHNDVAISDEYATFFIQKESGELLHIGCLDADSLTQFMSNDYLFFRCKDHVPLGSLHIAHNDVELERIRRFALAFDVYVLDAQARQVRVGNKYVLKPSSQVLGRIASKQVVERGNVYSGDVHCGPPYDDRIYTIHKVGGVGGKRKSKSKRKTKTKRAERRGCRSKSRKL